MRNSSQPAKIVRREGELYRAFLGLDRHHRRRLALRILHNQKVLSDLYDHLLIREGLRESGRSIAWRTYLEQKKSPAVEARK